MEQGFFYSNGKLLLSGEYLVLKGALALAAPLKFGQSLRYRERRGDKGAEWNSYIYANKWLGAKFDDELNPIEYSDKELAEKLSEILKAAASLNPGFAERIAYYSIETQLNFDKGWGLGSSSTLISNISYLAGINPYHLLKLVSGGSGFDIACARSDMPLFFKKNNGIPEINEIEFRPPFLDKLYFIYLGNKQSSEESIKNFSRIKEPFTYEVSEISEITRQMSRTDSFEDFSMLMDKHEEIISSVLKTPSLRQEKFSDFDGSIKSLGAWGGDFAMIAWEHDLDELIHYLHSKGLGTIFTFRDIIL
ncbi:MAG: GYDIA family GHMP kinase [Candidatus Kapaibacterium sp.]